MKIDDFRQARGLKVIHLNVRSLTKHFDEICANFLDGKTAVLVLSETWLHKNVASSLIQCDGYYLLRYDRQTLNTAGGVKQGGGLCMYVRDDFQVKLDMSMNISSDELELFMCTISKENQKKIDLIATYRPPSGRLQDALDRLTETFDKIDMCSPNERIILGDLNIDFSKSNAPVRKVTQVMKRLNLTQLIKEFTRVTRSSATTIDVIFSNVGHLSHAGVINSNISDHLPVCLIKKKTREKKTYTWIRGRSYRGLNIENFEHDISQVSREYLLSDPDPNQIWKKLKAHYLSVIDKHCPLKDMKVTLDRPAYLNNEIIQLMKDRDEAYKIARRGKHGSLHGL